MLISAAKVTKSFGIKLIPELLRCKGAKSNSSVAPMLVQVAANLWLIRIVLRCCRSVTLFRRR
jgi:hypothetical protein